MPRCPLLCALAFHSFLKSQSPPAKVPSIMRISSNLLAPVEESGLCPRRFSGFWQREWQTWEGEPLLGRLRESDNRCEHVGPGIHRCEKREKGSYREQMKKRSGTRGIS